MTYNLTNFTNANDILGMSVASNDLVGGWFFTLMLVIAFVIIFVNVKNYEMKYALLTSSFITFVLAGFLWVGGLIPENQLAVCLALLVGSFVINLVTD